jgi:hypothetical protein
VSLTTMMQKVLDLADHYSSTASPAMSERDEAMRGITGILRQWVAERAPHLAVQAGGRQSSYSPIPWVRVFDKSYSPKATEGFYLVYLFRPYGSSVYLSLNQGTSVFRSGQMRPTNDWRLLNDRAVRARVELVHEPFAASGQRTINLESGRLPTSGSESRQRVQGYEEANVFCWDYLSGQIPAEEKLLDDLEQAVPLLLRLYGVDPLPAPSIDLPTQTRQPPSPGQRQGRMLDSKARQAIEAHAVDAATKYLESLWHVQDVGKLNRGYDLECRHRHDESMELHVEVKGTMTGGEEVILTRNEVKHVQEQQCSAGHALIVVSSIELHRDPDPRCSGGAFKINYPWSINGDDLMPIQYAYRVPA